MGSRSGSESLVAIYQAFLDERTWKQADLARKVGIGVPALKRLLDELSRRGMPLQSEEDHPHVYWSIAKNWFPGGVVFSSAELLDLLRLLVKLPRTAARETWVARLLGAAPASTASLNPALAVVPPFADESDDTWLPLAEDSFARKVPLRLRYLSTSRGRVEWRHASVQRIRPGPPNRLVVVCHRDDTLKNFRADSIVDAQADPSEAFRERTDAEVGTFIAESLDGFHDGRSALECVFFVREPDARWVARNLPPPLKSNDVDGGIRVKVTTGAVLQVARFVVGLGAAARPESTELKVLVRELAEGALAGAR